MKKSIIFCIYIFVFTYCHVLTLSSQTGLIIKGTVYDASTHLPLEYATVIIDSTSVGVACNTEGVFELNIPSEHSDKMLKISYIGFKPNYLIINNNSNTDLRIYLEPFEVVLSEVLVKSKKLNARGIVNKSILAIPGNYEIMPSKMECFYREITYEDNTETAVTEALLEVYKSPLNTSRYEDQVKVVKVSGANAGSGFKFEGGAFYRINDDIIKNRISFLDRNELNLYNFDLDRVLGQGEEAILVISFSPDNGKIKKENTEMWGSYKQNHEHDNSLYSGELFIREKDFALLKAEYWLEAELLNKADKTYLTQIPEGSVVEMTDVRFTAEYRKTDNRYYLYYTDGQICFRLGTERIGLSRTYRMFNQIITVSKTYTNVQPIPSDEVADYKDLIPDFKEKYDKDFWKDHNIIKAYSGLEMMGESDIGHAIFRDEMQQKLINYWYENPVEKIFLHTDRNRYISGEEIFFKAYVIEQSTGFPSYLSKTFYVILADSTNKMINKVRYILKGGFGSGSINLPNNMAQGEYRLIAYPAHLQNLNPDDCFVQSIEIEDKISFAEELNQVLMANDNPAILNIDMDVQFLAEGGQLISGVRNNIAVCAISLTGSPQKLKMVITDNLQSVIDSVETNNLGLAKFSFKPEKGRSYQARVIKPDKLAGKIFKLPPSQSGGVALSVISNNSSKISLILRSPEMRTEMLTLMLLKEKEIISSTETEFKGYAKIDMQIDNNASGVVNLVIFRGKVPIAERLLFLDTKRRLNIEASPEYGAYPARGKMDIKIRVEDQYNNPVRTNLSLSVIDSINCISDKFVMKTIQGTFWLESSLKKAIPFQLPLIILDKISNDNENFQKDIDLLLLTYGWRMFSSDDIIKRSVVSRSMQGKNYDIISGKVSHLTKSRRKASRKEILVMDPSRFFFETIYTDIEGRFAYQPERFSFDKQLIWDFGKKKDRGRWKINIDPIENMSFTKELLRKQGSGKRVFIPILTEVDSEPDQSLFADLTIIPEVTVTHTRGNKIADNFTFAEALNNIGNVSTGSPEDFIVNIDLKQLIYNIKMPRREFIGLFINIFEDPNADENTPEYGNLLYYRSQLYDPIKGYMEYPVLYVVDDIPISVDYNRIDHITPDMVESISIISGPQAHTFFGSKALGGAVMIYLKNELEDYLNNGEESISSVISDPLCNTIREFYKPNYESDSLDASRADYRLSVHWEPNIVTDENGEATVMYYNAGYNSYVIGIINGMSFKGEPISHRFRYRVLNDE